MLMVMWIFPAVQDYGGKIPLIIPHACAFICSMLKKMTNNGTTPCARAYISVYVHMYLHFCLTCWSQVYQKCQIFLKNDTE